MAESTEHSQKYTEDELAAGNMFQLVKASSVEFGVTVIDNELRECYKIRQRKEPTISLPELATIHHRTWFCIGQIGHIPKVAVATAELQSMLLHSIEYYDPGGQHLPKELQWQYLRSALAYLLLIKVKAQVSVDDRGRPKRNGQLLTFHHFGDLHIKDDYLRIGLGEHVGAAKYWMDIPYTKFQEGARLGIFDRAGAEFFPTMIDWFHDTGSSGTPHQSAPSRLSSSRPTTLFIDLSEVEHMEHMEC